MLTWFVIMVFVSFELLFCQHLFLKLWYRFDKGGGGGTEIKFDSSKIDIFFDLIQQQQQQLYSYDYKYFYFTSGCSFLFSSSLPACYYQARYMVNRTQQNNCLTMKTRPLLKQTRNWIQFSRQLLSFEAKEIPPITVNS